MPFNANGFVWPCQALCLVDRIGRTTLLLSSAIGMMICCPSFRHERTDTIVAKMLPASTKLHDFMLQFWGGTLAAVTVSNRRSWFETELPWWRECCQFTGGWGLFFIHKHCHHLSWTSNLIKVFHLSKKSSFLPSQASTFDRMNVVQSPNMQWQAGWLQILDVLWKCLLQFLHLNLLHPWI